MSRRAILSLAGPLALIGLLAGCETVPPEQRAQSCAQTDWMRFGQNDGRLGVATSERADQFEDCKELGVPVDIAAYQAGRLAGLETFCTAENGYEVGFEGRRYQGVCPPALEPDFLQGYTRGRKERPIEISPRIGIGIGSSGRTRIGVGIGLFSGHWGGRLDRWDW